MLTKLTLSCIFSKLIRRPSSLNVQLLRLKFQTKQTSFYRIIAICFGGHLLLGHSVERPARRLLSRCVHFVGGSNCISSQIISRTLTNRSLVDLAVACTTLTALKILTDWQIDWLIWNWPFKTTDFAASAKVSPSLFDEASMTVHKQSKNSCCKQTKIATSSHHLQRQNYDKIKLFQCAKKFLLTGWHVWAFKQRSVWH